MTPKITAGLASSILIGTGMIAFAIADAGQLAYDAEVWAKWVMGLGAVVGVYAVSPSRKTA